MGEKATDTQPTYSQLVITLLQAQRTMKRQREELQKMGAEICDLQTRNRALGEERDQLEGQVHSLCFKLAPKAVEPW
jgi:hypothetical protein